MHIVLGGRRTELKEGRGPVAKQSAIVLLDRCGVKGKEIQKTGKSMIMIMMTARLYVGSAEV